MIDSTAPVIDFDSVSRHDVGLVGGKNASLGEMIRNLTGAGVRVPPGFATTAAAYRRFIESNGLESLIRGQLAAWSESRISLAEAGAAIRAAFMQADWPANSAEAILKSYRALGQRLGGVAPSVAVRSSATAEDLPDASFAGQQETYLNVAGETELLLACKRCYASLFTDRAISYRQARGYDHLSVALSVGVQQMVRSDRGGFGVIEIDSEQRLRGFVEKPPLPRPIPGKPDRALASMGIYLFDTRLLMERLEADAADGRSSHDFGKDIIPALVRTEPRIYAHSLKDVRNPARAGYWRDVGTLDAYWQTSLELAGATPPLDLIDSAWPVRAVGHDRSGQLPDGAVEIRESVVSRNVAIGADSRIERSILLPGARIGAGSTIRNAIVDEGCRLPPGSVIGLDPEQDRLRHSVTASGLVLVSAQHGAA